MKILKVRRLNPQERGSSCEIVTGRGSRCNYSARRIVEFEGEDGRRIDVRVCRIHLKAINEASSEGLVEMFSRSEAMI